MFNRNDEQTYTIEVTIPSRWNNGTGEQTDIPKITRDLAVRVAKTRLSQLFGGFTAHEGNGGWINSAGHLITESVTIVSTSGVSREKLNQFEDELSEHFQFLKYWLRQDALFVRVYPNTVYFI